MREAVSDVLVDRARYADRFSRMVLYSLIAHGVLITAIILMPASWRQAELDLNRPVMTITLGGTPGPDAGGRTSIADRAVQEVAPPQPKPAPQPPPAAKQPEMVLPSPAAKVAPKTPPKPIEKPADKSSSQKPTTGAEIKTGSAKVQTGGAATEFGGLSTGGGGAGGARVDVQNFCCPGYLETMVQLIRRNWSQNQGMAGQVDVKFVIQRNGLITGAVVEKPSGLFQLDQEALRAVIKTKTLPPLPREFPDNSLTVHVTFDYQR